MEPIECNRGGRDGCGGEREKGREPVTAPAPLIPEGDRRGGPGGRPWVDYFQIMSATVRPAGMKGRTCSV